MKHSFQDRDGCMVFLDGNLGTAMQYLSFAKQQIIVMLQQFGEDSFQTKTFLVQDTLVICKTMGGQSKIYIKGAGGDVEFLHGLVDGGNIMLLDVDGNTVTETGDGVTPNLNRLYPSSDQAQFEVLDPRAFRLEPYLAISPSSEINPFLQRSPYITVGQAGVVQPSLFSGKMRKVVQALLGRVDYQLEYRWGFYKTDGILTDSNGNDWLIRIANGVGVIAKRIDEESYTLGDDPSSDLVFNELGYIPTGESFPIGDAFQDEIASGSVKRLLTSTVLNAFYVNNPFYDDCGWCFNATGNEAQNTCWGIDGDYKKAKRYKISISINSDTGEPESASMQLMDEGFLYHSAAQSRFHVPKEENAGELMTFIMKPENPLAAAITSSVAPLHVWYDGDAERVVKFVISMSGTASNLEGTVVPASQIDSRGPVIPGGTTFSNAFIGFGRRYPMTTVDLVSYVDVGTVTPSIIYGFDIPDIGYLDYKYSSVGMRTASLSIGGPLSGLPYNLFADAFSTARVTSDSSGLSHAESRTGSSSSRASAVAVSPRDRSGIFVSIVTSNSWSSRSVTDSGTDAFTVGAPVTNGNVNGWPHYDPVYTSLHSRAAFSGGAPAFEVTVIPIGLGLSFDFVTESPSESILIEDNGGVGDVYEIIWHPTGQTYGFTGGYPGGEFITTQTLGAGETKRREFYFISDMTGKVDTGYTGIDIDEMYAFHPDPLLQNYMGLYSSQSYMKGSSYFSSRPNTTSGSNMIRMVADAEPLDECSSRVSWVGVS